MQVTVAPGRPELTTDFRRRRALNWLSLGILYAFFYMTRYNYTAIAPLLADTLGWRNTELGLFETLMPEASAGGA